ncbi:twin-arginine translocase subunit TatC [bacterium]|nr:twin-arginine translocase subunit TatC [bacterium]
MKFKKISFDERLPFSSHLAEIRYRLIRVIVFLSILFVLCFSLSETILDIVRAPIINQNLIFISPTEAFFVHLKLGFFTALALSIPFILYHVWAFIAPGLKIDEQKNTLPFVILSSLFFTLGILFAYYIILPLGLDFLLKYKTSSLVPNITVGYYISFIARLLLVFGVIFELPLIVLFFTKIGILKPPMLTKNRKYSILIIFIVSAILTPPDVVTQILMAVPLVFLYELSVIICRMVYKQKQKNRERVG